MPELFGASYRRADLLRRVGRLEQVAGVRLVTLGDGQGRGVRVLEFRTGTGFAFDVLVDRGFDVGRCELGGRPLSWLSGAGVVAPWYYEPDDWGWFRAWGGGMVVTCGLDHTLMPGEDTAEHTLVSHMFLYHCNVGFPIVDEGAELLVPSRATTTDYGVPVEGYQTMSAPVPGATEACFEHELMAEPDGTVPVAVVNRDQALGAYQVFRISELPHHTVWRMMGEGTYALVLEPSTNRDAGRQDARERGELQWLAPGEERSYVLETGALAGATAIREFEARVSRLAAPGGGGAPGENASNPKAVSRPWRP
jgi:hypothetical protein